MNTKPRGASRRHILLSLIKADLINCRLVFGLSDLGLNAGVYFTDLNEVIFSLAGLSSRSDAEALHEQYFNLTAKTKEIDLPDGLGAFDDLSEEIYTWLVKQKSVQEK